MGRHRDPSDWLDFRLVAGTTVVVLGIVCLAQTWTYGGRRHSRGRRGREEITGSLTRPQTADPGDTTPHPIGLLLGQGSIVVEGTACRNSHGRYSTFFLLEA